MVKRVIISIISFIFQLLDSLLCRLRLKRPKVILYMDGGICSQMMMYLHGRYYAEHEIDVYYDITWYEKQNMNRPDFLLRRFELTEMWPKLVFEKASKWNRKYYLLFFQASRNNGDKLPEPSTISHSLYLNGYWDLQADVYDDLFARYFHLSDLLSVLPRKNTHTVGVHVRRGDLAKGENPVYGGVTEGYFLRAIEFCEKQFSPKKYIFFSDEPDWVEQNICPYVRQSYEIMRYNKAWEDLLLLAQCPVIIASQGSFGKVAARLNSEAVLIQCDNEYAKRNRKNTYLIK